MLGRVANRVRRAVLPALVHALGAQGRAEAMALMSDDAAVRTPVNGGEVVFFAPTVLLRARAASMLTKEPDTIAWLDTLTAGDLLWDIGANVGSFTLYAAVARRCRVLAFEPSAANFYVLTRNIQLNAAEAMATAYCVALSGVTSLGVLNLDSAEPGAAMSQFGRPGETSRYSVNATPASHGMVGYTVDDFITGFDAPVPSHLKIDVDGLEWPILQGARATLSNPRVRALMVELSLTRTDESEQAVGFLRQCGLRLASRGDAQGAGGEQAANHFFVRA
jgi:FkbM family methyltransferase